VRLLVDACVARQIVQALRSDAHDVTYVEELGGNPSDEELLRLAVATERVIVTRDKDFGELAVRQHVPHRGILQIRRLPLREQIEACRAAIAKHADDLAKNCIVTVQPGRIRIRRSPI
jgi:predicted nuclease of predicted toxin-antitoxin system